MKSVVTILSILILTISATTPLTWAVNQAPSVENTVAEPIWVEGFRAFDPNRYHIQGDTYWDEDNRYFVLTKSERNQVGRIFFSSPFEMLDWVAEFDIRIWGGGGLQGGADGMTFAFVRSYNYPERHGGSLDFGGKGYGVEFDTYPSSDEADPQGHHIGLLKDDARNHLMTTVIPGGFRDNDWRHVRIVFTSGRITVYYDGKEVISNYLIPNYTVFTGYFGFTAATGGGYEWHVVRNIYIAQFIPAGIALEDKIANPGDQFTTSISVRLAEELRNFSFELAFAPSVLEAISIKEGSFIDATSWQTPIIDNKSGVISNISGRCRTGKEDDGDAGVLAIVTFKALDIGSTDLTFQNLRLLSPTGEEIKARAKQGLVDVYAHGSISGVVLDAETEEPIKGAKVELSRGNFTISGLTAYSADDGTYTLSGVPVGDFDAKASKGGYMSETTLKVHVKRGKTTQDISVKLTSLRDFCR